MACTPAEQEMLVNGLILLHFCADLPPSRSHDTRKACVAFKLRATAAVDMFSTIRAD